MATEKPPPSQLSVAERKRRQRGRLKDAGLTAVEVWIPPKFRDDLRQIEQQLRRGISPYQTQTPLIGGGDRKMDLNLLRNSLDHLTTPSGFHFEAAQSDGDDAITVIVENQQEFPVLVWLDGEQILCVTYLWDDNQIDPDQRAALLSAMLELNVTLPLSSFGKIGNRYVIFGALSSQSPLDIIIAELEALSDNTLEAVEIVSPYLRTR